MRPAAAIVFILVPILAGVTPVRASDPMVVRPWPVDAPPAVSSSFCEYREGHLHAGIDVRTYGREGIACIAAGDGYVSRVRAAPTGYGKVVYLQLDSGETLVYAHLSQFSEVIDSMVVAHQRRLGRYRVDFRPTPNRIRVRAGEVIAFSGSTGGVDPHLHFEVRNRQEHPLDPFAHGFALDDTLRPVIERIELVPLDPGALIEGECFPLEMTATRAGPGRYVVDDTVAVFGAVGVRLLAWDPLNADSGRLAPRTMDVSVDDLTVSRLDFDMISFANSDEIGFVYDVGRVWTRREYWFQLYERTGETLWGRTFRDGGRLPTAAMDPQRVHELRVTVGDVVGNRSDLLVPIRRSPEGAARTGRRAFTEVEGIYGFEGFVSVAMHPRNASDAGSGSRVEGFDVIRAADLVSPAIRPLPSSRPDSGRRAHIAPAIAGEYRSLDFDELGVEVRIDEKTLYTDAVLYAMRGPGTEAPENLELAPRTDDVRIGPYSTALKADMTLVFDVDRPDSNDAVYRLSDRSGKWVYYPSELEENAVSTTAKRPGVYAVFRDATPPRVAPPLVAGRLIYASGERLPEIQVTMEDTGSGIDYDRCAVFLDGVPQIVRWDGRLKKLFVLVRDENIMGAQALTVVAYDNVGHRTQLDVHVDIPRRK